MKSFFWPGIALGVIGGTVIGIKMKSEEKQVKRTVHKAKRNMEDLMDTIGM